MPILRRALWLAAKQLASDPRSRRKAAEVYQRELRPRAVAAWRRTRPRIDAARDELREATRQTDPRQDPRGFAADLKRRFLDRGRRD